MTMRAIHILLCLATGLLMLTISRGNTPEDSYAWIRGANYVPSYARNDVQTWMDFDPVIIDRELGLAARLKLNSVRIFLQYAVYQKDPGMFRRHYETFLELCRKHGIRAQVVLFDSCFGEFPDVVDYRGKDWMSNPGQNLIGPVHWPELERYISDVVGAYITDDRILMWDIMNEPLYTSYVLKGTPESIEQESEKIWAFVEHFLDVVKATGATQPRTVGFASSDKLPRLMDKMEVLSFHNYTGDMEAFRKDVHHVKALGEKHGKAVLISEVARRNNGQHFNQFLPILAEEKVGWYFWELMLGSTQFSSGPDPIQGVVTTDGKCFDPSEIAAILAIPPAEAVKLFPKANLTE